MELSKLQRNFQQNQEALDCSHCSTVLLRSWNKQVFHFLGTLACIPIPCCPPLAQFYSPTIDDRQFGWQRIWPPRVKARTMKSFCSEDQIVLFSTQKDNDLEFSPASIFSSPPATLLSLLLGFAHSYSSPPNRGLGIFPPGAGNSPRKYERALGCSCTIKWLYCSLRESSSSYN